MSKRRQYVLFLDPNVLADVKQQFCAISNFPNVLGAIDCTHKLHPPVVMMLGDSSIEKMYFPLMSKLPVMPKRRLQILSLGGLEVHMTAEFSKKSFCQNIITQSGHNIGGGGGVRDMCQYVLFAHTIVNRGLRKPGLCSRG